MQMSVKKSAAPAASPSQVLSAFLASIRYQDLPQAVVARTGELFLDWFASTLAGKGVRMTMSAPVCFDACASKPDTTN